MFSRRPVQYLGLLLLVLTCLGIIFFPVGSTPKEQVYTVYLTAPKPFADLIDKKKNPGDEADKAFDTQFVSPERVPGALTTKPGSKEAEVQDYATTRAEAEARSQRIVASLSKVFKGVALGAQTEKDIAKLPVRPLFALGDTAVFPMKQGARGPVPAVKLGLDLQGGVNLVLQIRRALFTYQLDKPIPASIEERDKFITLVRDALQKAPGDTDLARADVVIKNDARDLVEVRTQAKDRAQFDDQKSAIAEALKSVALYKFTPSGNPQFYEPVAPAGQQDDAQGSQAQVLSQTIKIVEERVDRLGVSEPVIQAQPPDRIIVQLPGVNDPQQAVDVVGQTAQMEIRLLDQKITPRDDPKNPDNTLFFDDKGNQISGAEIRKNLQYSTPIVKGDDLKPTTSAGFMGADEPAVFFELQPAAAQKFGSATAANVGRLMPIFLDDRCISAPVIKSAITGGSGQISGGFKTITEAQNLALLLNSGALPAPLDVVENRSVSATLGAESLNQSLLAGFIGILAVMAFMMLYYRLPGLLANAALVIYCLLNLAAFILIGGTLTLPGIAGFLLGLAMSLDTNILVFERLKEEMAVQPTFTAALRAAFARAWTAILDSHVTTLIAATVLFYLGTGPVKGFALTLAIGVLLSLFSAISVTRLFMWSVAKTGETNRGLFAKAVKSSAALAAQKQ